MNRFQLLLSLAFLAGFIFTGAQANNSDESESGSGSNESGNKKHGKKHNYHSPSPPAGPQGYYGQPNYHYNHPVYMPPQGPPPPYISYYPAPMPHIYSYPPPSPHPQPMQQNYGAYPYPYPYGGQFSQPQYPQQNEPQVPQGYPGIPGGTSNINHSLKVNKEYKEEGHHYRPNDSTE